MCFTMDIGRVTCNKRWLPCRTKKWKHKQQQQKHRFVFIQKEGEHLYQQGMSPSNKIIAIFL